MFSDFYLEEDFTLTIFIGKFRFNQVKFELNCESFYLNTIVLLTLAPNKPVPVKFLFSVFERSQTRPLGASAGEFHNHYYNPNLKNFDLVFIKIVISAIVKSGSIVLHQH